MRLLLSILVGAFSSVPLGIHAADSLDRPGLTLTLRLTLEGQLAGIQNYCGEKKYPRACLWGISHIGLAEVQRPTLHMGSPVAWTGLLDRIKQQKAAEWQHSSLSASWLWWSCDQAPPAPASAASPLPQWATCPGSVSSLLWAASVRYSVTMVRQMSNTDEYSKTIKGEKTHNICCLIYTMVLARVIYVPFMPNYHIVQWLLWLTSWQMS